MPLVAYESRMSDLLFSFGCLGHLDDSLDIALGEMNRPRVLYLQFDSRSVPRSVPLGPFVAALL